MGEKATVVQASFIVFLSSFLLQYQDFRAWVCDQLKGTSTKIIMGEDISGKRLTSVRKIIGGGAGN
jgi:hypothetical protein